MSSSEAARMALSSSVLGGKNSNDRVGPAASSSSMRTELGRPSEVVLETHDVVLAEVTAVLDLDEDHRHRAVVLAAVRLTDGDVDARSGTEVVLDTVEDDGRLAAHDEPMFGALVVELIAQALAGSDDDALHLVVEHLVVEHRVTAPRPLAVLTALIVCRFGHRTFSAARTALRNTMARVMGPTPPSRGVIQATFSATSSAMSLKSFFPANDVPAPTTALPSFTMSAVTMPGTPAADTITSAVRVNAAMSSTPVCTTVTAALQLGRRIAINSASGRPIVSPRPMMTTCLPSTGTRYSASNSMMPAGVQGNGPGTPITRRPRFVGCSPSTSLAGLTRKSTCSSSMPSGNGSCTRIEWTSGLTLNASTTASISACVALAGRCTSKDCTPISLHSSTFIST